MPFTRRTFLKNVSLAAAMWPMGGLAGAATFQDQATASGLIRRGAESRHSVCAMCRAGCLIDVLTNEGRLLSIDGNPNDALTDGRLCVRGKAAMALPDDPDRLKFPLKRLGKRGEGKWVRIDWGEAIDTIFNQLDKRLRADGPDSLALFHSGSSSSFIKELFVELGCRQINDPVWEYCQANRELAYGLTFGGGPGQGVDFDQAQCIVLLGSPFGENVQVPIIRGFSKALERGARLIVADPRLSTAAGKADYHLMLRPGTDTALLLGWLKYIIENGLYNQDVEKDLAGFSELKAELLNYRLDDLAAIADVQLSDLKRSAEMMAAAAPAVLVYPGQHSAWYGNDVQRLRAQAVLSAVLGARRSSAAEQDKVINFPATERMASSIIRKAQAGKINFIGIWGQNPLQAHPNPYRTISALEKVDFIFCCDVYPGEAALYADIILPEASFLERAEIIENRTARPGRAAIRQPVIEPRFEAKGPYWIVKQISSRLGRGRQFAYDSVVERLDHDLRAQGLSWPELQTKGFGPIQAKEAAPAKVTDLQPAKIHIVAAELGSGADSLLPSFEPAPLPPAGFLRLLYGPAPVYSRGMVNNRWLRHEMPVNELWLNDRVAAQMGIRDGSEFFLENQDGIRSLVPIKIKITPGIRVDCVYMAHGFGCRSPFLRAAFNKGVSDTSLMTRTIPDSLSGIRGMRVNFVRFVKDGKGWPMPQLDRPPELLLKKSKWWLNSFGAFESGDRRTYV